jgi:hypothetical protein
MSFSAIFSVIAALAWFVILVRAAAASKWWLAALYAWIAAGLADLLFLYLVVPDVAEASWLRPWGGIAFTATLLALSSRHVRAVRAVGTLALLIGAAWTYVAMRELFGGASSDALEFVWWAGLIAVHLMTFDAARRYAPAAPLAPYGQAFD